MRVRFWGTRGSIPKPGPTTLRHGGNTSCVELRSPGGTLVLLDCGTGAHALGHELTKTSAGPLCGHILVSHTHWDHIQGFPFFSPLRVPGGEWHVYGPHGVGASLRHALAGQMQHTYFPVTLEELSASVHYHDLVEGRFDIGDIQVTTRYLNHTALALGYRLETEGTCVVYATDHEPHSRRLAEGEPGAMRGEDEKHAAFLAGADLVIHDTQYTAEEYSSKVGWGHSTVEYAVDASLAAGARRLALFHHDPGRDDESLEGLVVRARERVAAAGDSLQVFAAAEGQVLELPRSAQHRSAIAVSERSAVSKPPRALREQRVLVAVRDPVVVVALNEAARPDGLRLLTCADGDDALARARSERPSLLVLEHGVAGLDALQICREIRAEPDTYAEDLVIVLVAERDDPIQRQRGSEAGVTDWLVKPLSSAYANARLRAWLLRTACRWNKAPIPDDEEQRIAALHRLGILDTEPEERFDRYTRIAAALFDVPIALVTLVDTDRQWFKSCYGLDASETTRDMAFCAHAILHDDVLHVPDALEHPDFADNPLVTGDPHARFYAGAPLRMSDGSRIGTLCLVDHRPRRLTERELSLLRDLGNLVVKELAAASPHARESNGPEQP